MNKRFLVWMLVFIFLISVVSAAVGPTFKVVETGKTVTAKEVVKYTTKTGHTATYVKGDDDKIYRVGSYGQLDTVPDHTALSSTDSKQKTIDTTASSNGWTKQGDSVKYDDPSPNTPSKQLFTNSVEGGGTVNADKTVRYKKETNNLVQTKTYIEAEGKIYEKGDDGVLKETKFNTLEDAQKSATGDGYKMLNEGVIIYSNDRIVTKNNVESNIDIAEKDLKELQKQDYSKLSDAEKKKYNDKLSGVEDRVEALEELEKKGDIGKDSPEEAELEALRRKLAAEKAKNPTASTASTPVVTSNVKSADKGGDDYFIVYEGRRYRVDEDERSGVDFYVIQRPTEMNLAEGEDFGKKGKLLDSDKDYLVSRSAIEWSQLEGKSEGDIELTGTPVVEIKKDELVSKDGEILDKDRKPTGYKVTNYIEPPGGGIGNYKGYGDLETVVTSMNYIVTGKEGSTSSGSSKSSGSRDVRSDESKTRNKKEKSDSPWENLFGSSNNKVVLERGDYLIDRKYGSDAEAAGSETGVADVAYDNKIKVVQKRTAEGGTAMGDFEYQDKEGNVIGTMDRYGGDIKCRGAGCTDPKFKEALSKHQNKVVFNRYIGGLQTAQGWSALSSLFGTDTSEARAEIDKMFHNPFLGGSSYYVEEICYRTTELPEMDSNSLFQLDADGNLIQTATIVATKQKVNIPDGTTKYMYKVSFYIKNPEPPKKDGKKDTRSTSGGVKARGSGTSSSGLTRDEKNFWNFVKKESQDIKGRYSTAKTSSGEDIIYNVRISGDRTIYLFEEDDIIESGKEVFYTNQDSFVAYSDYDYLQACIIFEGEKPLNSQYDEVSQLCTVVQDVTGTLPVDSNAFNDVSSDSSGSSRGGSEFSTGDSKGRGR